MKIELKIDKETPQYSYEGCMNCTSLFGKSLCSHKNRGCCWYFPKFTLHEIARMAKSKEGLETLDKILNNPKTEIYNYYIHAKGYFDEEKYNEFMRDEKAPYCFANDKTIFFRECPFVEEGKGCTIPPKFRSYVCNFFICEEVLEAARVNNDDKLDLYIREMNNYSKWIEWDNYSLEMYFLHKGITLKNGFNKIIEEFKNMELEEYEYPTLPEIVIEEKILSKM